jgi:thioredoxin reductase
VPSNKLEHMYDVAVIGGGPAGLSAAFWLARYRRRVVVFDDGDPRNEPAWAVHGYPGLPDVPPLEFRKRLRDQACSAGAEMCIATVEKLSGTKEGFTVTVTNGAEHTARRVVLAYGLRNDLPSIPGFDELYGRSVFHCPDCDGPSVAGGRIGVIGHDRAAANIALFMLSWTERLTLFADGQDLELDEEDRGRLAKYEIETVNPRIARLVGKAGRLTEVVLEDGSSTPLDGLFFHYGTEPSSDLAKQIGCECEGSTTLLLDSSQETTVPGIYGAGDLAGPPYLTISAAAGGSRVALSIHRSLIPPDRYLGSG